MLWADVPLALYSDKYDLCGIAVTKQNIYQESFMLKNSEFAKHLQTKLKGYKVAWDAALTIDEADWIIGWPKLQLERKIKQTLSPEILKWIKKWKSDRYDSKSYKNYSSACVIVKIIH